MKINKIAVSALIITALFYQGNISASPGKPKPGRKWTNSLGMRFVYVAPGSFMMGKQNTSGWSGPAHKVTISKDYWIGKYEVTQNEYQAVMDTNPSYSKTPTRPVERVTWYDAMDFCKKLTERERKRERLPDGYEYRLPTEAEWEFAARGGNKNRRHKYSGSNLADRVSWYNKNSQNKTQNVGLKTPNELEIFDMSGNVYEWCADRSRQYSKVSQTDPVGGRSMLSGYAIRGGGYRSNDWECLVWNRGSIPRESKRNSLGFRVVLGPELSNYKPVDIIKPIKKIKPSPISGISRKVSMKDITETENYFCAAKGYVIGKFIAKNIAVPKIMMIGYENFTGDCARAFIAAMKREIGDGNVETVTLKVKGKRQGKNKIPAIPARQILSSKDINTVLKTKPDTNVILSFSGMPSDIRDLEFLKNPESERPKLIVAGGINVSSRLVPMVKSGLIYALVMVKPGVKFYQKTIPKTYEDAFNERYILIDKNNVAENQSNNH